MDVDTSVRRLFLLLQAATGIPMPPLPSSCEALEKAEKESGPAQERWLEIAVILEARGR